MFQELLISLLISSTGLTAPVEDRPYYRALEKAKSLPDPIRNIGWSNLARRTKGGIWERRGINSTETAQGCDAFICTLGGHPTYDATLQACACPQPTCSPDFLQNCTLPLRVGLVAPQTCSCIAPCADQGCQFGASPQFNETTRTCSCPAIRPSCNQQCPQGYIQYNNVTNTCTCVAATDSIGNLTNSSIPTNIQSSRALYDQILLQDVTSKVESGMAQVFAATPDFPRDTINFTAVLPGTFGGLSMIAPTAIIADDIGNDPEPILVVSPAHVIPPFGTRIKSTKLTSQSQSLIQILAVNLNKDKTISFYCQIPNGTVLHLISDGFIQDADIMDLSAPPELLITTSHSVPAVNPQINQILARRYTEATKYSVSNSKRALKDTNAYNSIVDEAVCARTRCTGSGKAQPAKYNPIRGVCYCMG